MYIHRNRSSNCPWLGIRSSELIISKRVRVINKLDEGEGGRGGEGRGGVGWGVHTVIIKYLGAISHEHTTHGNLYHVHISNHRH